MCHNVRDKFFTAVAATTTTITEKEETELFIYAYYMHTWSTQSNIYRNILHYIRITRMYILFVFVVLFFFLDLGSCYNMCERRARLCGVCLVRCDTEVKLTRTHPHGCKPNDAMFGNAVASVTAVAAAKQKQHKHRKDAIPGKIKEQKWQCERWDREKAVAEQTKTSNDVNADKHIFLLWSFAFIPTVRQHKYLVIKPWMRHPFQHFTRIRILFSISACTAWRVCLTN